MLIHQPLNSRGNYNYNAFIYQKALFQSHFHKNYELIYSMDGETEITLNNVKYSLLPGELILISPYTIHSIAGPEGSKTWVGVFSEDFIPAFSSKNMFTNYIKIRCSRETDRMLKKHLLYQGEPERYMLIACLYMVCNECSNAREITTSKNDNHFMYKVIEYISENQDSDITLKTTAERLNYEYHYFSALFHNCFCMNFKSFVNHFKFETACSLLAKGDDSITEICAKCGFGSIRNFNRIFKQLSGTTPGEYRKKLL